MNHCGGAATMLKSIDTKQLSRASRAVTPEGCSRVSRHRTIDQHERMAQVRVEQLTSGGVDQPQERSGVGRLLPHGAGT